MIESCIVKTEMSKQSKGEDTSISTSSFVQREPTNLKLSLTPVTKFK